MSRLRVFLVVSVLVILTTGIASASTVIKIRLDDTIQPISDEYIGRAIEQARQTNADAVLIELSTPGGLVDSTRSIVEKMLASPVPVIVYVAPAGARAASAGFFILEAADVAAMAPGTNTGAAHPVNLGGEKMDDVMKQKVENDAAAFMRSFVGPRGRNVALAESAVRESKSWTDKEALDNHLIDYIATDQNDLFKQMDGKPIRRFNGKTVTSNLVGAQVIDLQMTVKQRILDFLLDPNIAFIVLAIGALALYAEFNHPGAIVPGVVGNRLHPAGTVCAEPAAHALCGVHAHHGGVCDVRLGSEVRNAWNSWHRGHCADDRWRVAAGRRANSRNAREALDCTFGEHSAGSNYGLPDEHRAEGAPQQGRYRSAGNDRHSGRSTY